MVSNNFPKTCDRVASSLPVNIKTEFLATSSQFCILKKTSKSLKALLSGSLKGRCQSKCRHGTLYFTCFNLFPFV